MGDAVGSWSLAVATPRPRCCHLAVSIIDLEKENLTHKLGFLGCWVLQCKSEPYEWGFICVVLFREKWARQLEAHPKM